MKILSVDELLNMTGEELDILDGRVRSNAVAVDDECIVIKIPETNDVYEIERARLKTPEQALDWIHQLSEKPWMWKNDKQIAQFSDQSCVVKEKAHPRTEVIVEKLEI